MKSVNITTYLIELRNMDAFTLLKLRRHTRSYQYIINFPYMKDCVLHLHPHTISLSDTNIKMKKCVFICVSWESEKILLPVNRQRY